jgi:hypothetical protein
VFHHSFTWQDTIAVVVGVPALLLFLRYGGPDRPTPARPPKRGIGLDTFVLLSSIWRSGGRS